MSDPLASPRLVVAGVLHRTGRILATRRTRPDELAGRWEFPGGKAEVGETPEQALLRELREELGIRVSVGPEIVSTQGFWPIDDQLAMRVFWVGTHDEPSAGEAHDALRWLTRDELEGVDWVPADIAVAGLLGRLPWPG